MRRSTRQNLLLVGAVVLLGGAVAALVRSEQQAAARPLSTLLPATVEQIAVRTPNQPLRRFERRDGNWWMREPYDLPAHPEALARLLAIAAAPTRSRTPATQLDARKIGLAPAVAVLQLGTLELQFGATDALHGDRYVRVGDDIALVPDRFSAWLLAPPESELDHRLASPQTQLSDVRIDGQSHAELVSAWSRVTTSQVTRATSAQPAQTGAIDVELVAGPALIRYRLVRTANGRYAAWREAPALVYPLDEAQMQQLLPPAAAQAPR